MDITIRTAWDLLFLVIMVIVVISVPVLIGFSADQAYGSPWSGVDTFMLVVDVSFVYDMYMQTRCVATS
jgi:hypothetical protein